MGLFLWGLKLDVICGIILLPSHFYHYDVKNPLLYFIFVIFLLIGSLFIIFLLIFELYRCIVLHLLCKDPTIAKETFSLFAVGGCLGILGFLHKQNLAPIVIGSISAVYFLGERNAYKRSYPWVALGCFLSGALAQSVPWPTEMRIVLMLFGVGISATLQGAWIVFCNLSGHQLVSSSETDHAGKLQMPDTLEEMQTRESDISWDRIRSWFGKFRKA
jgi:hypothetical protein